MLIFSKTHHLLSQTGLFVGILSLSACISPRHSSFQPTKRIKEPQQAAIKAPAPILPKPQVITLAPQAKMTTKLHQLSHQGIRFSLVSFDSRDFQLQVVDQPNGPGSSWSSSKAVANKHNAIAAINAGFFTPEGKPLGLVIDDGVKRGHYNASSLGKGIYYTTADGAQILRSTQWKAIMQTKPQHLLQSGPMLVEKGHSTRGLSSKSSRPRSFIATDGNHHWLIGHADSCNLAQLGKALASIEIQGFKVITALNLDGGRSSDLFVNAEVANGPLDIRPFWNKPVRNFLILKKK